MATLTRQQRQTLLGLYAGIDVVQYINQTLQMSAIDTAEAFGAVSFKFPNVLSSVGNITSLEAIGNLTAILAPAGTYGASLPLATGPRTISQPPGSVVLSPGELSAMIPSYSSPNVTYWLRAGNYTSFGVLPPDGTKIYGEYLGSGPGQQVVISGFQTVSTWLAHGTLPNVWYATPPNNPRTGAPWIEGPRSANHEPLDNPFVSVDICGLGESEDLYKDGVGLIRTLNNPGAGWGSGVGSGTAETVNQVLARLDNANAQWFWDYAANRIYVYSLTNPNSSTMKITTRIGGYQDKGFAFQCDGSHHWTNGRIENVIIEGFAEFASDASCAIQCNEAQGLTVDHCEIRNCSGGVNIGPGGTLNALYSHHNRLSGFKAGAGGSMNGTDYIVQNCEFSYNAWMHKGGGFEGGTGKLWQVTNILIQNNYSHDNYAASFWADYCRQNVRILQNTIENDWLGPSMEMSQSGEFAYNKVSGCGTNAVTSGIPWAWGGFFVYSCANLEIHHNQILNCKGGIGLQYRERGWSGRYVDPEKPCFNWIAGNVSQGGDLWGDTRGFQVPVNGNCVITRSTSWASHGTGSIRMTAASTAMAMTTEPYQENTALGCRVEPNMGFSWAAVVRPSANMQARITAYVCDWDGTVVQTIQGNWTSLTANTPATLSVAGTTVATTAIGTHIVIETQNHVANDYLECDDFYVGLTTYTSPWNWTFAQYSGQPTVVTAGQAVGYDTLGWVPNWGEARSGIYGTTVHHNDFTYSANYDGYTGVQGIDKTDYVPFRIQSGRWHRGVSLGRNRPSWYANTYRHSGDPYFANGVGPSYLSNPGVRFIYSFAVAGDNADTSPPWYSTRYIPWSYWTGVLGFDTDGLIGA